MGYFATEQINLTASTKTANLIAGQQMEFLGEPSVVRVYAVSSASGVNLSVFADSDVLVDDQEIVNIGTTLNRNEHLIEQFNVAAGTRLFVTLREADGTATSDVLIELESDPL